MLSHFLSARCCLDSDPGPWSLLMLLVHAPAEAVTWDDFGNGFTSPPGGDLYHNRSVLSFHFYIPPQVRSASPSLLSDVLLRVDAALDAAAAHFCLFFCVACSSL